MPYHTVFSYQMGKQLVSKTETVSLNECIWIMFVGLIITPSFVCLNSQELRNETYDVLLKNPQQSNSIVSSLPTPTTSQPQLMLNREVSQLPHNSTLLFNTNLESLSPPVVQTYTQPRNNLNVQPVIESNQFNVASFGNTRNNAHADAPNFSNAQPAAYHEEEII